MFETSHNAHNARSRTTLVGFDFLSPTGGEMTAPGRFLGSAALRRLPAAYGSPEPM
jgi:hypothetical protein